MPQIGLTGDTSAAAKWIGYAMQKLSVLKRSMSMGNLKQGSSRESKPDAVIDIQSGYGLDKIRIKGIGLRNIIICYVGDTTGDFSSKRFYNVDGKELGRDEVGHPYSPPGWVLTDDGLYGPTAIVDPLDPWSMTYSWPVLPEELPGGLRIPKSGSGISPKKQTGKLVRYILDGAIEDETFQSMRWTVVWPGPVPAAYSYYYDFVRQVDSLTYAPYAMFGPRPFFTKYLDDQVVTMIVPWSGYGATLTWDAYQSYNFWDVMPKVHRIWKIEMTDGSARTYTDILDYGDDSDASIGAVGYREKNNAGDYEKKVKIIRAKTETMGGGLGDVAEPIRVETYNLTAGVSEIGTAYHRCADLGDTCFFWDAWDDSGWPNTGSTIGDDVRVPHSISADGKQTYVRIQKTGYFDSINTGLYCGDDLVEESGWEGVTKLFDGEEFGPLLIRQTRYRIIHVHADDGYKAVIYSKTVYVSHSNELIPYTVNVDYQVRKNMIQSHTTYHLSVNGVITDLGYSNYRREYRLTANDSVYVPPPVLTNVSGGHIVSVPWVDCGYDSDGNALSEDNSCVMRCDTNVASGQLLVGFDVYPVKYRHDLVFDSYSNLTLVFDESVIAYPPATDARYSTVKDRKWLLFSKSGKLIRSITPPQKQNNGGHVNRINGLAYIGA